MAQDNIETEVKLYVPDLESVAKRLETLGAKITAPRILERNTRYEDLGGWIASSGTVIRLRQDTRVRLTYKDGERTQGEFGSSRYEAEVEVSDFKTMETILDKLGFHPALSYEKYRTTYELDDAEITLDEMPYGNFVEIEADEDAIGRMVEKLELQNARRMVGSYTTLFKNVRANLGLKISDLTFKNFEGINVPPSAFDAEVRE
jgi:adenylate cyclase, class 2